MPEVGLTVVRVTVEARGDKTTTAEFLLLWRILHRRTSTSILSPTSKFHSKMNKKSEANNFVIVLFIITALCIVNRLKRNSTIIKLN